ncbi:MAG TPA: BTAD domain-containing putative transcriptional regulator, partial [Actinomycetota bacterium]|nr:BTAD domain-containing putative transcriptional regulator [Actinomycetota bacterium]
MKFRILGPFDVERDGRSIRLGGRKQRTLLAYLVLRSNKVVTNSQLVDALWSEDPPNTATQTIHVYVSQLRKALDSDDSGAHLVTEGAGYVLRAAPDNIDLTNFEATVKDAKATIKRGAVDEAAALLRRAISMWRGPALGELATEQALRADAARLDEMRRSVMEELVDIELSLGRHAEVVGELRSLVADDPLREGFRAQLMLALYRQGRQAQALEVYEETRRLLADELGIDPSRDLKMLHEKVLRQDPSLDPPPRPSVAPARARPDVEEIPAARRVGRPLVVIALVVAALVVVGAAAIWRTRGTGDPLAALDVDALALLDPAGGDIEGLVDFDMPITKIAVGYGSVWVTSEVAGTLARVDPSTRSVRQTIQVGSGPSGIAFGEGAVWVTLSGARTLARIDPETNDVVQRLETGNAPTDVAFAAGHLWTTNRLDGTVSQIDPGTTRTIRTIRVGPSPVVVAGDDEALWIADSLEGTVARLDPTTGSVVASISVGNDPSSIAIADAVWVTNALDGTVSMISSDTNRVVATVS